MGKKRKEECWLLFIDETGTFDSEMDDGAVAGLLVREPDATRLDEALRSALSRLIPMVPYPIHTAWINQPAFWPCCWTLDPSPWTGEWKHNIDALERAMRYFEGTDDATTTELLACLSDGVMPDYDTIRSASKNLWIRERVLYHELRGISYRVRDLISRVLSTVVAKTREDGCGAVVAAPAKPAGTSRDRDLYLQRLGALFERLVALFRSPVHPRRTVVTHIARRNVNLGGRLPITLSPHTAATVASKAVSGPPFPPARPETSPLLRLVVEKVWDANRNPEVPAGIVLADFISNRLGWALKDDPALSSLQTRCLRFTGLPLSMEAHGLRLPAVAADGVARDILRESLITGEVNKIGEIEPRWAKEQLAVWLDAAASLSEKTARGKRR